MGTGVGTTAKAQNSGHQTQQLRILIQRVQPQQPHAVGRCMKTRTGQRKPSFAHTTRPVQRQQLMGHQFLLQTLQIRFAADQAGLPGRQIASPSKFGRRQLRRLGRQKPIATLGNGFDVARRLGVVPQRGANGIDGHLQGGVAHMPVAPHRVQQFSLCHQPATAAGQELQHRHLARLQRHHLAGPRQTLRDQVQLKVTKAQASHTGCHRRWQGR